MRNSKIKVENVDVPFSASELSGSNGRDMDTDASGNTLPDFFSPTFQHHMQQLLQQQTLSPAHLSNFMQQQNFLQLQQQVCVCCKLMHCHGDLMLFHMAAERALSEMTIYILCITV